MITVACGMEDEGSSKHNIERHYNDYKDRQELEGMIAMTEFEYIHNVVVGGSRVRFRNICF